MVVEICDQIDLVEDMKREIEGSSKDGEKRRLRKN